MNTEDAGPIYRSFAVWKRTGAQAIRYRCFQLLPDGGYCVQSADFYDMADAAKLSLAIEQHDAQFLQLLLEEAPEQRGGVFASIEAAIEHHDREFSGEIG